MIATMICPACRHQLVEVQVGDLRVDACRNGCGGIWFDVFELQQVDDPGESLGETLLQIPQNPAARLDPSIRRECPRCLQMKLKRRKFSPKINVEVDECPGCGGFWLDGGELEQIRLEKGRLEKSARQVKGMSPAAIRAIYRLKTADRDDV
jgi:Zn-finger nucleic acid-binding protein